MKNIKDIQCVNCGERGHVIKTCTQPVTSFGIILFKIVRSKNDEKYDKNVYLKNILKSDNDNIYPKMKFLLMQRRNTMGYTDFLRGKYNNQDVMNVFLNEITKCEKNYLENFDFDKLWDDLWINKNGKIYKNEYMYAKNKYMSHDIKEILKNTKQVYNFQEFSIPKGRKNINEDIEKCAEREMYEETGYNKNSYRYILDENNNKQVIVEQYIGTDNIEYKHVYFIAQLNEDIKYTPNLTKIQKMESKNIGWFTLKECLEIIRPYDIKKKEVLIKTYKKLVFAFSGKK